MALFDDYPLLKGLTKQPDGSYHPADIKALIEKQGSTLEQISLNAGLGRSAISVAFKKPYTKGEIALATFLNIPVQYVFPTRWDIKGNRVRPRYAAKYTTVADLMS